ncbi:hypothetical protein D3C73_1283020 [compost metagenome]
MGEVRREHHGHVESAFKQALLDGFTFLFVDFDGHVRMPVLQTLQVMRQEVANHRVAGGQPQQAAGTHIGQRAVQGVVDAAQNHIGPIQKVPPGIGQAHALGDRHHAGAGDE